MSAASTAMQNLTLGEVAAVENLSGQPITSLAGGEAPMGKTMAAMAYVLKRRSTPDFTFEDALNLTMEQANEIMGFSVEDPTE